MKSKAFSRDERKEQVVLWFALRIQKGNESGATANDIGRALGMSRSSHLNDILWEMVQENTLDWRVVHKPGKWAGREYRLHPGSYTKPSPRSIALRVRGRVEEQLELF